jgi:predicted nucleotidyltransferase
MTSTFLQDRATYSQERIGELRSAVETAVAGVDMANLTIFTVGSFARLEASEHSDIDLFFTYHPSGKDLSARRTNELKLFGRLIDLVERLGFPAFSNDAQYLQTHNVDDVLAHLGGRLDDASNHFTARMLLLLESKCVYGDAVYEGAIRAIINSYYRDFPRHEETFQPWFLMNDIMRFWKTLLVNYENKRNRGPSDEDIISSRVKNFKLRYSRMTTCFATIAALGSFPGTPTEDDVFGLTQLTPQKRLAQAVERMPVLEDVVQRVLDSYTWFLEQTSLSTSDLRAMFEKEEDRTRMFQRAEEYGSLLFELLKLISDTRDTSPELLRYLVL